MAFVSGSCCAILSAAGFFIGSNVQKVCQSIASPRYELFSEVSRYDIQQAESVHVNLQWPICTFEVQLARKATNLKLIVCTCVSTYITTLPSSPHTLLCTILS